MRGWLWYSVLRLKSLSMSLESFNSEEITGEETDRVDESTMDRLSFSENKEPRSDKSISKQLLETDLASTDASWGLPV